jgi:hypothetical protein
MGDQRLHQRALEALGEPPANPVDPAAKQLVLHLAHICVIQLPHEAPLLRERILRLGLRRGAGGGLGVDRLRTRFQDLPTRVPSRLDLLGL